MQFAQEAVQNAPDNLDARLSLVRAWIARGDLKRAETELFRLIGAFPDAAEVHAVFGSFRLLNDDVTGARAAYDRALKLDRTSFEAIEGLTQVDLARDDVASARRRIEERLEAEPNRLDFLMLAATVYVAGGDLARAEQTLKRVIAMDAMNVTAYALLGELYSDQSKLDGARAEFDALAQNQPKNISARLMAAIIAHLQNRLSDAVTRYEAVLALEPRSVVAANNLAWIYADRREHLDLALQLAQRSAAERPGDADVQDTLGWVYYQKQVPTLAIGPFQQSVAGAPLNPTYRYHLALAYARSGDVENARRAVEVALKLNPDFSEAQRLYASLQ